MADQINRVVTPIPPYLHYLQKIMTSLLLAYVLIQGAFTEAGPIPVSFEQRDVASCSGQGDQRTIYGIIWSCLSTIFLCTWVAVHPNIAFRREKPEATRSEKWIWDPLRHFVSYELPLFLWALLIPEYILAWSVRQYFQAGKIREQGMFSLCDIGRLTDCY